MHKRKEKVMEKENDNLAIEETLQILNAMAMDYYEMGLPELSEAHTVPNFPQSCLSTA